MRKFWIGLIGLAFISGLALAQAPAPTEKRISFTREILLDQIAMIQKLVVSIGEKSNTVSKADLSRLKRMVDRFFYLKKDLLKEIDAASLVFSRNDASEVAFILECQEAVEGYFDNILWYKDDSVQTIKKFFVKYTGRKMTIERGKEWFGRIFLVALMGGMIVAFIFGAFFGAITEDEEVGVVIGLVAFIIWFLSSLFLF